LRRTRTLLLVSHDRTFLDNVVTQTVAAESAPGREGTWKEYVGGYSDWLSQRPEATQVAAQSTKIAADRGATPNAPAPRPKLSFKERRELEALPTELEALEKEQLDLSGRMASSGYHTQGADAIRRDRARAAEIERELADKFERWAALDARLPAQS
jgi:ATP-binding cassette subfamily F protein uup